MARYISRASSFKKTVIKGEQTLIQGPAGPQVSVLRDAEIAMFEQGNVTPWEVERAVEVWGNSFRGVADGEEPVKRISAYDTDLAAERGAWSKETKAQVEKLLDAQQGQDYMRVDLPRHSVPWPTYDEIDSAEQIALITAASGHNVDEVLAYERENMNRPEVIAELEAVKESADADDAIDEDLVTA